MRVPLLTGSRLCFCAAAILALALGACGGGEEEATKVTFMAGYKAQANLPFVGAYVAEKKGFFEEQGLEVDIQHSSGSSQHVQLLMAGEVQFSTADAANVLERIADPGLPLVSIALIGQTGQQGWVTLKDSGLDDVKSWKGKTVAYRSSIPPDLLAILKANDMTLDDIDEVDVGFQPPQLLVEGQVDVYPVFLSNEPDTIERKLGREVNVFSAADYGAPTLGLTYITTQDYLAEHPDIARRFLKAVLRGIAWAQGNPEEATDIVLEFSPEADPDHERFMLETELAGAMSELTEANGLGWQTLGQWEDLHDWLIEFEAIAEPVDPADAFTDSVLREVYQDGKLVWP